MPVNLGVQKNREAPPTSIRTKNYDLEMRYDAGGNVEYMGKATIGTATSEPRWQIQKFTYNVGGDIIHKGWAESNDDFVHIFDNYASFTYS